ncbi:MAG: hypothetical protein IJI20_08035 [Firmicutes bacterium]|nr:hypothetical protein [Bacillota bacterium]
MSEQTNPEQEREKAIRRMVIAWLRESFETGDYRLLNRGGKTRSRDYYLQLRNRTEADLRELRVQLEIYKDGVLTETVTAKTGANGIRSGEVGQLAFFTKEIYFSSLKVLPETVTYKTDWIPGKVMATQEKERRLPKKRKKKKNSPQFQVSTADLLREKREEYLRRLGELKEATDDEEIRAGLEELIPLIEQIFARVEEAPGTETEIKRLTDRYLPMIINSAESYQSYTKKNIDGEDMDDLKEEVISGLKLVNEACGNLLTRLYEDGIVDASTDITVLKMMLKQDGLLDSDLPKE